MHLLSYIGPTSTSIWSFICTLHDFWKKTFGKFFRSYSELLSKFGDISFQEYLSKGISHPVFYGDLVYKLRRVKDTPNIISSGSKIVKRLRRRQYDPVIIERTIGIVIGPRTALYRPFLKHCTLTSKAVGTIWRALSKPPQRRQGPDLRPLWLLVGTPSANRPELAFSRAEHSLPYSDVTIYIFAISYLSSLLYVNKTNHKTCIDFYDLSAWNGCWFDVYIRRFIYKFLNVCPLDYTAVAGSGKFGPINQVNYTSLGAVVTPTDRPKSVRVFNRTFLWRCLCCHFAPFDISVGVWAFVIGLSQISSFLSLNAYTHTLIHCCFNMSRTQYKKPDNIYLYVPITYRAMRNRKQAKTSKWKYLFPSGIKPTTPRFPT